MGELLSENYFYFDGPKQTSCTSIVKSAKALLD